MRTEEAIEAVLRSIEAECEQTATVLGEKIQEWSSAQAKLERKVRKSTMERQAVVAEATEKKLASYEAMLGMRLDGLHTKFEKLQANLSAAILAADADQDI